MPETRVALSARQTEQQYALYLARDKTREELVALGKFADTPKTKRIMRLAMKIRREQKGN